MQKISLFTKSGFLESTQFARFRWGNNSLHFNIFESNKVGTFLFVYSMELNLWLIGSRTFSLSRDH